MTFSNKIYEWQAKRERKKQFAKYRQLFCVPVSVKKQRVRRYRKVIDIITDIQFFLLAVAIVLEIVKRVMFYD